VDRFYLLRTDDLKRGRYDNAKTVGYNFISEEESYQGTGKQTMQPEKLAHFKKILLEQLRTHTGHIREDQAAALEVSYDGVKDPADLSVMDVNKELALRLGERESQMVADIDQALLRIKEGSYGVCARCGKLIDERRLEALPTARYDANCQAAIEAANGEDEHASL
jgi:DnaK suppressor protein